MACRGPGRTAAAGPLLAAAALALGVALALGGARTVAAAKAPTLELVVEPLHPIQGTRAEIVAEVLPASLGSKGTMSARLTAPDGSAAAVIVQRVKGAAAGTFEGLAPVPNLGRYRVDLRYAGAGRTLTASRSFVVVKGSPIAHDLSIGIVAVILGGAWLLMRRRR